MKNLVQIITGCAAADTIEECARLPVALGATVIVVHGLWPTFEHPMQEEEEPGSSQMARLIKPTDTIDNVEEIVRANGWHFLQMEEFAFNGKQYNHALRYIREQGIPCDHIWFMDADQAVDPMHALTLIEDVERLKKRGVRSMRFQFLIEIVPGWKGFQMDGLPGNQSIVWGDAVGIGREEGFDGNHNFLSPVSFGRTRAPLLHLHHFRKNAATRIVDGRWNGGGKSFDLSEAGPLLMTPYMEHLRERYPEFHLPDAGRSSYVGKSIFARPSDSEALRQLKHYSQPDTVPAETTGNLAARHISLGVSAFNQELFAEALYHLESAFALAPESPEARRQLIAGHLNAGLNSLNKERYAEALSRLERAYELDPQAEGVAAALIAAHDRAGVHFYTAGNHDEALRNLDRAYALSGGVPEIRGHLIAANANIGAQSFNRGDFAEATLFFERAYALDPENSEARSRLTAAHANAGVQAYGEKRFAVAADHLERALALDPAAAEIGKRLTDSYLVSGVALSKLFVDTQSLPFLDLYGVARLTGGGEG